VAFNRCIVQRTNALKRHGDALFSAWTTIEIDSHKYGMLAATIRTKNEDIVLLAIAHPLRRITSQFLKHAIMGRV
jgi:hypothetical protein